MQSLRFQVPYPIYGAAEDALGSKRREVTVAMNVLAIIHAPVFSGPHNTMTVVAQQLAPRGTNVTILLPDEGRAAADRIRAAGVDAATLPLHRMRARPDPRVQLAWASSLRREVNAIVDLIAERDIDVVVTHTLPNLHGGLAARTADVACVWEIIDTFPPPVVRRAYMPIVLRLSDVVMTTGRGVGYSHPGTARLGDRWVDYFPCVDVERFRSDSDVRTRAREELGLRQDAMVVGNVAAISPMKGHRTFIKAAATLRRTFPDVYFVILGSRHEGRERYYQELWDDAERLGLKLGTDLIVQDPGARVSELAQAFDLFWMTSEPNSEGVPTVIGEAKALGLPVVAADVGSTAECVNDGVSGYLVAPRNPDAVAERSRKILSDRSLAAAMGRAARAEAEAQFAASLGAERHQLAFDRAVEHHSNRRRRGLR